MLDSRNTIISQKGPAADRFHIEWPAPENGSETIEVFAGASRESIDFAEPVCRDSSGSCDFDVAPATRHAFAVRVSTSDPTPTASRNVVVDGVPNFRDIGGYRVGEGGARQVSWGRVFRSGQFNDLTPAGQQRFGDLGIARVIDFRSDREREKRPNNWGGAAQPEMVEVPIDPGSFIDFSESFQDPSFEPSSMIRLMQDLNRQIVTIGVDEYRRMFESLLETGDDAVAIQCASGKDRTGLGAALILLALGADRETVRHDYLLTRRYLDLDHVFKRAFEDFAEWGADHLTEAVIQPMFDVRDEYIDAAFAEMDERYGGPDGYLRNELKLSDDRLAALRELFLD